MTLTAQFDFWKDAQKYYKNELALKSINSSLEDSIYKFLLYKERLVSLKPRKVFKSKELVIPSEVEKGLTAFENAVLEGKDINSYQSKGLLRLDEDDMYNEWNIRHFHLGEKIELNSQMIERTKHILMAIVNDDSIYFIQIEDHNAWTKVELLDIVNRNWRELLNSNLLNGVSLAYDLSDDERKKLRKNNVIGIVKLEMGEILLPPNLGNTTAGTSIKIQKQKNHLIKRIKNIEDEFNSHIKEVTDNLNNQLNEPISEFEFHLDVTSMDNQDRITIIEKNINRIVDIWFNQ